MLWSHPAGLPHAVLIAGPAGLGKRQFAEALAARLLCEKAGGTEAACGVCDSCRWFEAGNHPDMRWVIPEADAEESEVEEGAAKADKAEKKRSNQILVDQIRALADFVYVGAHRAHGRVIVIQPAETMTSAAANSLLKILEEPPSTIYFILISDAYRRLLPTIRSRCGMLLLSRPERQHALEWLSAQKSEADKLLELTGGMPLRAKQAEALGWNRLVSALEASLADIEQDELGLASSWEGLLKNAEAFTMDDLIALMQKWLSDLLSRQMTGRTRYFVRSEATFTKLLTRSSQSTLMHTYYQMQNARALANHPLNPRLFLEDLAARYLATFASERAPR